MVALTVVSLILAAVIFDVIVTRVGQTIRKRHRRRIAMEEGNETLFLKSRITPDIAQGVFHTRSHTWLLWQKEGKALVGMDDLLHRVIGRFDEVRLPSVGQRLNRSEKAALVRQGDRVLYFPSPASGVVREINTALLENPGLAKSDPYGAGWFFSIQPTNPDTDIQHHMIMRRAADWSARETERIREFFVDLMRKGARVRNDGGAPAIEGILEKMDDKVWVIFKDLFIYQHEWRS